jgi:hypothetical protein
LSPLINGFGSELGNALNKANDVPEKKFMEIEGMERERLSFSELGFLEFLK